MANVPKITPHLWFDSEAKEAAAFYCSVFPGSTITQVSTISGVPTPSGDCDVVSFELGRQPFRLFPFSFRAAHRTRSTTTGKSFLSIRRPDSAAGSRTSSAYRGKSGRERWAR
jgi:predicted 3-demethylubiquinone-9 3-methyltransferase (glyoxalase superfamily)